MMQESKYEDQSQRTQKIWSEEQYDSSSYESSENYEDDLTASADQSGHSQRHAAAHKRTSAAGSQSDRRIRDGAKILAVVAAVSLTAGLLTDTSVSTSTGESVTEALETHTSSVLEIGTVLMDDDDTSGFEEDYTITHSSTEEETTIWVWDYAAEDGDYVQILIDGVAMSAPFMITNKAVSFTVPTVGEIQILGTRDGGGGITYGVYYEINQTIYFNGMDEGGDNLYTLVRE